MTTHVARMTMQRDFTKSEDLRVQADSCRQLALLAQTERNRLFWLRLAGEWAELAVDADRQDVGSKISDQSSTRQESAPRA